MPSPQEIPQLATELIDMSREYLRQETIEPAKALGKHASMGIGGAMVVSLGAFFLVLGLFSGLRLWLPEGEWYEVLARFLTALGAAGAAGLVVWRMQSDDQQG
ncbi:MAG: phage holin family protein [Acidimicrobiia bacterium]